ncbi:hypothetical protein M408DRAFT_22282 [Serendipita vermifera MAFF 305830]|uniref:C2H2-type domain-containing protein n=1 Tax=Serendipita vermifera MAFF 305830 TaxID=933852 RepID=A0A0C3BFN7_SERVB|nr:hypothetical protein M408DRAFT_22282 [Serendipita vermifera MAFF 305830]
MKPTQSSSGKSRRQAASSRANTPSASPLQAPPSGPALPDYMQTIMDNYSGNTPASRSFVQQHLEEDLRQHPTTDLISVKRRQGVHGRRGGVENAICRECDYKDTFQKVAEHVTSTHWGLPLWSCTVPNCTQAYHRKQDLGRHHWDAHQIPTSRAARRAQPAVGPASPPPADPGLLRSPHASSSRSRPSVPYPGTSQRPSGSGSRRPSLSPATTRSRLPHEQWLPPPSAPPATGGFIAVTGPGLYLNHPGGVVGSQSAPSTSTYGGFPQEGPEDSRHSRRAARHAVDAQQMFNAHYDPSDLAFAPRGQVTPTLAANPYMAQGIPGMQPPSSAGFNPNGGYTTPYSSHSWQDNGDNHSPGF